MAADYLFQSHKFWTYVSMTKKPKIVFLFLIFSCFASNRLQSQDVTYQDFYGTWNVKDLLYLQMIGNETSVDYKDRMAIYHRCLKAKVKIDGNGIKVLSGAAQFELLDECDTNLFYKGILSKRIVPSNNSSITNDGSEMIDSNIVGSGFIKRFDSTYRKSYLSLIDTNCKQGFGDYTMKICIANKNKIGLFTGGNLIILERTIK
jgi:hypothetical protein